MKTLLMYMPVVHKGYIDLIERLEPDQIMIVSDSVADKFDKRRKDIRALSSRSIVATLHCLFPGVPICEFEGGEVVCEGSLHMPVEDISEEILGHYLVGRHIVWESVFLRYDSLKSKQSQEIVPDRVVSRNDPSVLPIIALLEAEAAKSPDWFRQVSAAVVKDDRVLSLCHNVHVPSDVITATYGDPRSNAKKGIATNISKSAHAEPLACFRAGVEGCKGATLFASTFPCPQCANFLSFTGLRSLYFVEGYAMVDGAEDLRSAGMEIVKVE
jgi:dCMP deaminase